MYKLKRSQILLSFLASLLALTPLLSSSLRTTYLYFIINLLIIALGAEAGLLSSLLSNPNPHNLDEKRSIPIPRKVHAEVLDASAKDNDHTHNNSNSSSMMNNRSCNGASDNKMKVKVVEKCSSEKISFGQATNKLSVKVKRCPSTPSIFFIGGGESQPQDDQPGRLETDVEEEEEEVAEGISGQELFTKAENFIGNFYKQLKMQREDSWKKIHGFYQKAF